MAYLANPSRTMEIVKKYDLSIQKKFGQNFLINEGIIEDIIDAAKITKDDIVLEIGPGIGTLTQYIAESAKQVICVEIDKMLMPILADTLSEYQNVEVINNDILKVNISELIGNRNNGNRVKVVANLPYYITTPIIMKLLEEETIIESITVMIQKEVADRMEEGPGSKDYGALSLAVQYYSKPEIVTKVPPSCFIPQPGVDSAVITLRRYDTPPVEVDDETYMFKLVRAAFNQRRKTLMNGLTHDSTLGLSKEKVSKALDEMGISATIRGEALSLQDFANLSNILCR
ncbi:MAG: 16S rRNA (adenine(1518)-N(6)/adenine(1519)-N(6))-dimethyltransferase RsmA [Butyrivibrio sp.]|nr:16S rRNA (adenine(1518)-N(6)/adenine(1519)-N(6))-dimethyltransferase RsmA [Butyrivibrio sp.]